MRARIEYRTTYRITGVLQVCTGLLIGAGKDAMEIGGVDNPVVKHPHTLDPYIPGSSLKGKLRCLLEWFHGVVEETGEVYGSNRRREYSEKDPILRIFGTTHENWKGGPTRLIVRDAFLDQQWRRQIVEEGLPLTEEKTEVSINRLKGKAETSVGPRRMERVPAGAIFNLEMLFKEYAVDGDEGRQDRHCLNVFLTSLKLLEQDSLGGSGSRGYGRVSFKKLTLNGQDIQGSFESIRSLAKERPFQFLQE